MTEVSSLKHPTLRTSVSPLVMELSIITINLNNVAGLKKTFDSVFSQTYRNYEYIVIDGGSTDGSVELIKKYSDRISYWISEPDNGIYHAMNKGVLLAHGNYLQFLNSGDVLVDPSVLTKVFSSKRRADIVYGDVNYVHKNGLAKRFPSLHDDQLRMVNFFEANLAHPASFIKRSLFDEGLYDEKYRIIADNKFFIEHVILRNCSVEYLDTALVDFDMTGISSQPENWAAINEERRRLIMELLPPRIYKDYDIFLQVANSPLLEHMRVLNQTDRFQHLVAKVVSVMVNIYLFLSNKRHLKS